VQLRARIARQPDEPHQPDQQEHVQRLSPRTGVRSAPESTAAAQIWGQYASAGKPPASGHQVSQILVMLVVIYNPSKIYNPLHFPYDL